MDKSKTREVAACLGCGSSGCRSTGPLAPPIQQPLGGQMFEQPAYRVLECEDCGLLYKTPVPAADELARDYDAQPVERYDYRYVQPTEKRVIDLLATLPAGARVLDFGCNTGRLLSLLPPHLERHGFEINQAAADSAAARGIHMIRSEEWLDPAEARFDAVVLVDVFEHLDDPTGLLGKLWANLRPGGLLVLSTGNGDHWACRLDPARFWYFRSYEHLVMLTRRFTDHLAQRLGGGVTEWQQECHYADPLKVKMLSHITHAIYWMHRRGPGWLKAALNCVPKFRNTTRAECPPTYACCKDHVIAVIRKP